MDGRYDDRRQRPEVEITPPPREGPTDLAGEFAPPPEEFPRPGSMAPTPETPRKKRRLLRAFMAIAAAVLTVWLFTRPAAPMPEAVPTPAPEENAVPEETPAPTPDPEPTATPEPTPTPPPWDVYPLREDGEMQITVFGDMFNDEYFMTGEGDEFVILLRETIPEAEFTEFALPYDEVPEFYDPFVFCGFALHCGNRFDPGFVPGMDSFVVVLGDVLTREDVERIPVSDDGVRYVNIHTMWRDEDELITDPSQYGLPLTLDDGMGNTTVVEAKTPLASEGYTYLAVFPVPEREGYAFTGWYDPDGNRVDYVTFFQFFREIETEWGIDYDWMNPILITLTAGWEPVG